MFADRAKIYIRSGKGGVLVGKEWMGVEWLRGEQERMK